MNEWEEITNRILKSISIVKTNTKREEIIKVAILVHLYKLLQTEEYFNDMTEVLNKTRKK